MRGLVNKLALEMPRAVADGDVVDEFALVVVELRIDEVHEILIYAPTEVGA
jgi:hypothetical protein